MADKLRKRDLGLLAALLFYSCIALFFFREAIFTDRVQVCSDTILNTYPWALERPKDFKPRNLAISDQCTVFYPWFHYNRERLQEGDIPLWTPHVLAGAPYLGNFSPAIWYPLNLLVAVLPLNAWFLFQSLVKVVASGLFTFLFLRKLKLKFLYSLFGGAAYACSGWSILWVISHLTSVAVFMPVLLWTTEKFLERRRGIWLGLLSLFLGVQFLGAQPEVSLCMVTAWGIYTFFRIKNLGGAFNWEGAKQFIYLGLGGILAVGLVTFQLWPFLEYVYYPSQGLLNRLRHLDARSLLPEPFFSFAGLASGVGFLLAALCAYGLFKRGKKPLASLGAGALAGGCLLLCMKAALLISLKPHFLIQLFPDLYGNPLDGGATAGGRAYPEFNGGYAGILTFFLALVAALACARRHPVGVFSSLFILSFGAVHGIPVIFHFIDALPFYQMVPPGRMLSVTVFSLCVLSAFGLEHVVEKMRASLKERLPGLLRAAGAASVILVAALLGGWTFFENTALIGHGDALDEGKIKLAVPKPGHAFRSDRWIEDRGVERPEVPEFRVEGSVAPEVRTVFLALDGIGVGQPALEGRGEGAWKHFSFSWKLDRFEEGLYWMKIELDSSNEQERTSYLLPVSLAHPKRITGKNLLTVLASAAVLSLLFFGRFAPGIGVALALAMLLLDSALLGMNYNCTTPPDQIFPDNYVTRFLSAKKEIADRENRPFRILPENVILQPSTHYMYEYEILRGYEGLEIPEYNKLINLMKKNIATTIDKYNSRNLDYESPVLDLLGVKYIITEDDLDALPGLIRVREEGLPEEGPLKIYENMEVMDRAFVVGNWINLNELATGRGLDAALADLRINLEKQGVDLEKVAPTEKAFLDYVCKNWAYLEEEIDIEGGGSGKVAFEAYENEYIRLSVEMEGEGILVLTDNYFPGWRLKVDGEEREILRNLTFRAVPLKDGRHTVEFTYRPDSVYMGAGISLASLVLLLLITFIPFLTRPLRLTRNRETSKVESW